LREACGTIRVYSQFLAVTNGVCESRKSPLKFDLSDTKKQHLRKRLILLSDLKRRFLAAARLTT